MSIKRDAVEHVRQQKDWPHAAAMLRVNETPQTRTGAVQGDTPAKKQAVQYVASVKQIIEDIAERKAVLLGVRDMFGPRGYAVYLLLQQLWEIPAADSANADARAKLRRAVYVAWTEEFEDAKRAAEPKQLPGDAN